MKVLAHPIVRAADAFAEGAHAGQVRKGSGLPYISHPRAVAALVARHFSDPLIVASAVLHDVLEDTPTSKDELQDRFGIVIANLVDELTKKPASGNRHARVVFENSRIASTSDVAKSIKCADLHHNVMDVVQVDPTFARVYVKEKEAQLAALQGANLALWTLAAETVGAALQQLVEFANSKPPTDFAPLPPTRVRP